ncbi:MULTISPECIES: M15 family metallopeptidase [Dickeya]|uniref:FIG009095: D,D-carboxypeptidase family protein n=1 Tax=Dickeya aquatica TaxID=1401087 RepID=A0A375ACR4_9GAMM|nr:MULTISPECIES: M15 family metallopeptidase [Dickeya]SLM63894.1 FIG009095: D,D-carboxypeptidase family protein [Dickeya aquatica]
MISIACLTGKSDSHLVALSGSHRLQAEAASAFLAMQHAARLDGFNLQPASSFRDFERQRHIWNGKFNGTRPLLDENSQPIDALSLAEGARCEAILRWSALPGASRHHWGCDLDVYDPDRLPADTSLQLEQWEYQAGGYFAGLSKWLTRHMAGFGFYRPFDQDNAGVAIEPWHLSYAPLAQVAQSLLTPECILQAWQGEEIAGKPWLQAHLPHVFERFIMMGNAPSPAQ